MSDKPIQVLTDLEWLESRLETLLRLSRTQLKTVDPQAAGSYHLTIDLLATLAGTVKMRKIPFVPAQRSQDHRPISTV